tara:strand:+ start:25383 stop:26618 length:1236 start_codon:yes stop_codon:yes gene_type:complete
MSDKIENELSALSKRMNITEEEMTTKYGEIAESNGLDLNDDRQSMVALTLTRNFVRGSLKGKKSSGGFGDSIWGFIVGEEPARDVQEWKRRTIQNDYRANPNAVLNDGRIAEIIETDAGSFEKSQVYDGELQTKNLPQVPASAIEVDDGKWIVPVDNVKAFMSGDSNPRYGKPLPAEEFRKRVHVIAKKSGGDFEYYTLGLKNDAAKNWSADHYRWLHLHVILNEERGAAYGIKGRTLESLTYNDSLDPESDTHVDTSGLSMEDLVAEHMEDYVADLIELEDYHNALREQTGIKMVLTDGIVTSMNLTPNEKTGNRVMWIEPVDANYGFEDEEMSDSTPVWIPEGVDINFGIGSDVVLLGRTNQTQKRDTDGNYLDDEWNPVSINLFGVYARVALGNANVDADSDDDVDFW